MYSVTSGSAEAGCQAFLAGQLSMLTSAEAPGHAWCKAGCPPPGRAKTKLHHGKKPSL